MTGAPLHLVENAPPLWLDALPFPEGDTHKHARGALYCVTGGPADTGAARLAARAGLRVGAGLVTLLSPPSALLVNAAHVTAVMVRAFDGPDALGEALAGGAGCVIGPAAGVDAATRVNVLAILACGGPAVLDADALTAFEDDPQTLWAALHPACVLTPHAGEFRRLFGEAPATDALQARADALAAAAGRAGCTVLLKGAVTLVATPGEAIVASRHATPFLATAGSGDVLAGILGGLMAQGVAPHAAAAAAAWMHGEAGRRLGPGLIAEDLPEALPGILAGLYTARR